MSSEIYEKFENKKPNYPMRRFLGVVALSAALIGGVKTGNFISEGGLEKLADKIKDPYEYSEETATYVANPGDGLNNAAAQVEGIGGFEHYDIRRIAHHIENMPENEETLEDGLQVGEVLRVPKTVDKK